MCVLEKLVQTEGLIPSAFVVVISGAVNVAVAVAIPTLFDVVGVFSAAATVTHHDSTV